MGTLHELGKEYLDTAFQLKIRLKELQVDQKNISEKESSSLDLDRRIEVLYKEILYLTDIGSQLQNYEQRG